MSLGVFRYREIRFMSPLRFKLFKLSSGQNNFNFHGFYCLILKVSKCICALSFLSGVCLFVWSSKMPINLMIIWTLVLCYFRRIWSALINISLKIIIFQTLRNLFIIVIEQWLISVTFDILNFEFSQIK